MSQNSLFSIFPESQLNVFSDSLDVLSFFLENKNEGSVLTKVMVSGTSRSLDRHTLRADLDKKRRWKTLSFWRRRARSLFRVLLAVGFIAQSAKFLELYMQYPSTVELEVVQPSEFEMPAFTVCNVNEVRTSVYCEKYPDECSTPESYPSGFCKRFPEYCKLVNDTKQVPLHRQEEYRRLSRVEQQELGHQYHDLVQSCTLETDDEETNCTSEPILVPALSFSYEIPFNCFMLYSLHGRPNDKPERVPISTKVHLLLNLEVSEYHPDHLSRGAQLSIHSPYHVPSPVSEGLFLNMGTVYRIYVRLAEKLLLPYPYRSNCTDYESLWKANGGKGPVTEKMCKEKCKLDMSILMFGCVERRVDYPHNETICLQAKPLFGRMARQVCSKMCSSPCKMQRYEVQVQEADSEGTRKSCIYTKDLSCATLVHIFFENLEITTFKYTPRYEPIGILSFIGGYVGLWLGISLLTVYDFLEMRFFRCAMAVRKTILQKTRICVRKEDRDIHMTKAEISVTPLEKLNSPI